MRVLHTSDWHLGRLFHGESLLDDQAAVLDRIAGIVEDEAVELVLIAGDLYDRAIPPAPAIELFGSVLERFRAAGARIAAISGNHDSSVRVGGNDRLLNQMGVAIRGDHRRLDEPLVIDEPADGGPPVAVYLVPYLEPAAVAADLPDPDDDPSDTEAGGRRRHTQDRVVRAAASLARADLASRGDIRSVLVAHTFAAGGEVSDSERDLSVGFVDRVGLGAFDGFDLVALGHLHRPQRFDGGRIAYAGSILPYSFSEEGRPKSVRLVDLGVDGSIDDRTIPLTPPRPVRTIRGDLDRLLSDPQLADAESALLRVELTDRHLPERAKARLERRFAHILEFHHVVDRGTGARDDILDATALKGIGPLDLALRYWADVEGRAADDDEIDLLAAAFDAAGREDR